MGTTSPSRHGALAAHAGTGTRVGALAALGLLLSLPSIGQSRVPDGLAVVLDIQTGVHTGTLLPGAPIAAYVVLDSLSGGAMSACQYGIAVDPRLTVVGKEHHPQAVFVSEAAPNDFVVGFNPPPISVDGPYVLLMLELMLPPEHAGAQDLRVDVRPLANGDPMVWARFPQTWDYVRMVDLGGVVLNPSGHDALVLTTVPEVVVEGRGYLLHWNSYGSDDVTLQGQPAAAAGTVAFVATEPRTFQLSVGAAGQAVIRTLQVEPIQAPRVRSLRASPPSPSAGDRVRVDWELDGANEVRLDPGDQLVGPIGALAFDLSVSTAVILRATNEWGTTIVAHGFNLDGVPLVAHFDATPSTIDRGQSVQLRWHVLDADGVTIEPALGSVPTVGEATVTPDATTTYQLTASNAQGLRHAQADVVVIPVRIGEFRAEPSVVYAGRPATLRYELVNATQAWIEPEVGPVPVPSGAVQVTPAASGAAYVLHASDGLHQVESSAQIAWKRPDVTLAGPAGAAAHRVPVEWWVAGADTARIDPTIGPVGPEGYGIVWVPGGVDPRSYTLWARNAHGETTASWWYGAWDPGLGAQLLIHPTNLGYIGQQYELEAYVSNATWACLEPGYCPLQFLNNSWRKFLLWADEPVTWKLTASNQMYTHTDSVRVAPANKYIDLTAMPSTIHVGQSATLSWSFGTARYDSVLIRPLGVRVTQRTGSIEVSPDTTQTYEIVGWFYWGQMLRIIHDLATVEVVGPQLHLSADPLQPPAGTEFDLKVRIREFEAARLDPAPGPIPAQDATYRLRADEPTTYRLTGYAGADSISRQLTIVPGPPRVDVWRPEPSQILIGQTSELTWSVSAADSVVIEPGHRVSTAREGSIVVTPPRTRSFYLNVYHRGTVTQATTIVEVEAPLPPPDGERLMLVADPVTLEPSIPVIQPGQPVTVYAVAVRPSIASGAFSFRVEWPPCMQPTAIEYPPGGVNFAPAPDHVVGWGSCLRDTIQVLATFTLLPDPDADPGCLGQPYLIVPEPTATGGEFSLSNCATYQSRPFVQVQGIALGGQFTGWDVDALPPPRLMATADEAGVLLRWQLESWPSTATPLSAEIWRAVDDAPLQVVAAVGASTREWRDDDAQPGHRYRYVVRVDIAGAAITSNEALVQLASPSTQPAVTAIRGAFPNPFTSAVTLDFEVAAPGPVALRVYDVAGRLVRRADLQVVRAGPAQWQWDGRDGHGRRVAAGAYLMRMESGGRSLARRVLVLH